MIRTSLPSNDNLRGLAADILGMSGCMAWESDHRQRTMALMAQFAAGGLDADALRAALPIGRDTVGRSAPPKGVAIIPLTGVLTPTPGLFTYLGIGTALAAVMQQLRAAAADASIKAIVILVDSPGGSIGMVPETATLIRQIRAQKPVITAVAGMNASAAYWPTSNSTTIIATPSAMIGAIGVYTVRASYARQLAAEGVDVEVISAGAFKAEGLSVTAMTDAERKATQDRVDEAYSGFVGDVAAGRGVSASTVRQGFAQGRVVSAKQALSMGMIDRIAVVEDAVARVLSTGASALAASRDQDYRRRFLMDLPLGSGTRAADDDEARRLRFL